MAQVIELKVKADVQQATAGLNLMVKELAKIGGISTAQAKIVQTSLNKLLDATKDLEGLDFSQSFVAAQQRVNDSIDKMAAKAQGMETLFDAFGTGVNLSNLMAAFRNTDKSVEQLEAQMGSLKQAIAQSADPIVLQRFGDQLTKLQSQLANVRVVGAVKVEKIDIPKLNVPLVAPKIDLTALQSLQATFNSTIAPVDQLEGKIRGLEQAISKATNPAQVALYRAEIEKLKTQLSGLKFDRIDIDPTSLRILQSAFIEANKPLSQLEKEIGVLETVLQQATVNGSKDVERLSGQLTVLKQKFDTISAGSLQSAFQDSVKSAQQLQNEIFALGKSITASTNPEDIIRFSQQIQTLQGQLNNLKFGGIDLQIDTSSLSRLQSAFIDAVKPAQQLEQEIEALEQALKINADPSALKVYGNQIIKLKNQLETVNVSGLEKSLTKAGNAAQVAGSKYRPFVKGSNEALRATIDLGRVLQDAPFGFIGIANNINPLIESFQRLGKESGGVRGALKALGSSLIGPGGVGLALSAFQFIALDGVGAIKKMFGGVDEATKKANKLKEAAEAAKQASELFISSLDDITRSRLTGAQNAQEELVKLKLLYDATQNQNIAIGQRKKLVDQLQAQYPKYFASIKDEIILTGGAKAAYDRLTTSILATARAQAERENLVGIQKDVLTAEEKVRSSLRDQTSLIRQINAARKTGRKETETSLTGEVRLTAFGAKMVDLENKLAEATKRVNDAYREKTGLLDRATLLSSDLSKNIEANPEVLLDPDIKTTTDNKDKTQFLFQFLPFDPNGKLNSEQRSELLKAIRGFSKDFSDILEGVDFDVRSAGKGDDAVINLAKDFDKKLREGLVKFKLPPYEIDVDFVPKTNDLTVDQQNDIIEKFINTVSQVEGKKAVEFSVNVDEVKAADEAFKKLQKTVSEFAQDAGRQIGSSLGAPIEKAFEKIINGQLQAALNKGLSPEKIKEMGQDLANGLALLTQVLGGLQQGFTSFFETIITGGGNAFQKLGQAIQQMITKLIASLAAMAAISGILSLLFPGAGGFKNIFSGLIGSSLGVKPFASGGLVFGPTLGLIGEGKGTSRTNPEVIAPLDKLKNFINPQSSGGLADGQVLTRISGQHIDLVWKRYNNKQFGNG